MNDPDQGAALFVSDDGIIELHPEWLEEDGCYPDDWHPIRVEEAVGAGILTLLRERDEAREAAREIIQSVCMVIPADVAEKIRQRVWTRWPWLKETDNGD